MVRRSSLAAIVATVAIAAPAAATPVGEPAWVTVGSNIGLLYNPVDGVYVASSFVAHPFFFGYTAAAVPRDGPITARALFAEENPPFGDAVVTYDLDRNQYLVLSGPEDLSLEGFLYAGDGSRLHAVTIAGASGGAFAAVYNPARGEFLVAYRSGAGRARASLVVQRLDAAGVPVGAPTVVSDRPEVTAIGSADIAYRARFDEYLVVWDGQRADGASDVYAQRLDGEGRELGADDIRVSEHRNPLDRDANRFAVVAHGDRGAALVVWWDGYAVYGRRLAGRRARPGKAQIPYSSTGPPGAPGYPALAPAVAFHPRAREFLVVWPGRVNRVFGEFLTPVNVLFGQHVGRNGRPRGPLRFEVSPSNLPDPEEASSPAVAAAADGAYLAIWELRGLSRTARIYARRISPLHSSAEDAAGGKE